MKILLSAYACEPNKGSEPETGWRWALELARLGHEVWVLTRESNRTSIEAELAREIPLPNLHFAYYDLPPWARWWKRGARGVNLYYRLWQRGAYRLARNLHHQHSFDRAHHVTLGTLRHPTFLRRLGVPFVFGPVGGGERAPWSLRRGYGLRGMLLDALRDLSNHFVRLDPVMRSTFRQAETIYVKTPQTRAVIPAKWWSKVQCEIEIGVDAVADHLRSNAEASLSPDFRVLYVGRFLYWKGMHLGLAAFAQILGRCKSARLTLVGEGPEETRWRRQAARLGVADRVEWLPWAKHTKLAYLYRQHHTLLFPSLHDSSGYVVLEALVHGLPVVCLDLGGPAMLVNETCGRVIRTAGQGEGEVAKAMATALIELWQDPKLRERLSDGALRRAEAFFWSGKVRRLHPPGAATRQRSPKEWSRARGPLSND